MGKIQSFLLDLTCTMKCNFKYIKNLHKKNDLTFKSQITLNTCRRPDLNRYRIAPEGF